jgi:hypothetical protein
MADGDTQIVIPAPATTVVPTTMSTTGGQSILAGNDVTITIPPNTGSCGDFCNSYTSLMDAWTKMMQQNRSAGVLPSSSTPTIYPRNPLPSECFAYNYNTDQCFYNPYDGRFGT